MRGGEEGVSVSHEHTHTKGTSKKCQSVKKRVLKHVFCVGCWPTDGISIKAGNCSWRQNIFLRDF